MTHTYSTCHTCGDHIPSGHAHIRSVSLKQVAFCGFCNAVRSGVALARELVPAIPEQPRRSALSLRLESARRERLSA